MSRTLHLFGTDWGAMMVPIQVIRWYRMQCYDGTDSCATVVPIRRYCQIVKRAAVDYPHLKVVTYSPPYKPEFSDEDNKAIIDAINAANPDLLWIGMTAPKQEKWTYSHWNELNIHCHVGTIGAVFDFFAGTVERAPIWWQKHGLEWLYRLMKEPKRMWRRYIIGNSLFLWNMVKEA